MEMAVLRADGRWQAKAKDPKTGKVIFFYSRESSDHAEKLKEEWLNPPTLSATEAPKLVTVHDLAGFVWWPRVEASARPLTIKKYMADYKNHIRPVIGDTPLSELTVMHCQQVINRMMQSELKWKTRDNARMLMVTILQLGVDVGAIDRNPATRVAIGKRPPKRQRFMSVEKALEVLSFVKGTPNGASVTIAMALGLREAEISNLRWEHLDKQTNSLFVAGQAMKVKGKPIYEAPTKGGEGYRKLYIDKSVIELIESVGNLDSAFIVSEDGKQTTPDTIYRRWASVRDKIGLSDWTFHDFRHATLSLLQAIGAQPFTIMSILGHSKIDTTMVYESLAADLQSKATSDLAKILGRDTSTEGVK